MISTDFYSIPGGFGKAHFSHAKCTIRIELSSLKNLGATKNHHFKIQFLYLSGTDLHSSILVKSTLLL